MSKIPLKSGFLTLMLIVIMALGNISYSDNNGLGVGETSPNPEFLYENNYDLTAGLRTTTQLYNYKEDKILLIAFLPEISSMNNYAEVMTSAFETYFADGMAFGEPYEWQFHRKNLKVLIVTNNDQITVREYLNNNGYDFDMAPDVNMDMANSFGISKWNSPSDGAFVYVVNRDNRITYASHDYKGEGEKLRTVQKELFTQLNIDDPNSKLVFNDKLLFPGDKAIDFDFTYTSLGENTPFAPGVEGKLSDYFGRKNVIIAFYPAPFSMSCAMELTKFDAFAEQQTLQSISNSQLGTSEDVEILMISNSSIELLDKWKNDMKVKNVKLVADMFGAISSQYRSINSLGYNNRTLFIINKSGMISYIDWNYIVNEQDFGMVKDHLELISEK
jgi:peroxiredoxin (alkyl hydroperoxide reductase subunit C)